ncbi:MAG: alpha/beta hydrolase-fold protein [Chloroflexi bacterium]|nr:alpha/beta hydrolase-fold protein [Chloroflexota bacterium]MDA1146363.1 alpha/beta hydrolase-fold protein [Chloroflexota bacterium]
MRSAEAWTDTDVFAGTTRNVWIYRSAQLAGSAEPPALMVFQDGNGYVDNGGAVRVPAVLDTLVHAGELPPTVAVFVDPGVRNPPNPTIDATLGDQRSIEYDTLTDAYVTFLLDDLLPFVEERIGRPLSTDPAQRLIGGISSGGIAAFTAAWHRPDAFGRVLSHCGSFANIRGGHNYPYLVRTTEPKPLRLFLTSGTNDLDHPVGNWPLANKQLVAALEYAGYDYRFVFGEGGHSRRHGGAIFADSLRWLMR